MKPIYFLLLVAIVFFCVYQYRRKKGTKKIVAPDSIHTFFGLSYASYLVIPRSVLQSASDEAQARLVDAIEDIYDEIGDWEGKDYYQVQRVDGETKKFKSDPLRDYQRGRRRVSFKDKK